MGLSEKKIKRYMKVAKAIERTIELQGKVEEIENIGVRFGLINFIHKNRKK